MANVKGMTKQSVIRYIVTSLHRIYGSTTQRFNDLTWRSHSSLSARGAFTLIELIVVVTVIVILTGLVLSTVGYVQKKAARSRAETEIAAMSAAWKATRRIMEFIRQIRDTRLDSTRCDLLRQPSTRLRTHQQCSLYLYEQLLGVDELEAGHKSFGARSYFTFKPNML